MPTGVGVGGAGSAARRRRCRPRAGGRRLDRLGGGVGQRGLDRLVGALLGEAERRLVDDLAVDLGEVVEAVADDQGLEHVVLVGDDVVVRPAADQLRAEHRFRLGDRRLRRGGFARRRCRRLGRVVGTGACVGWALDWAELAASLPHAASPTAATSNTRIRRIRDTVVPRLRSGASADRGALGDGRRHGGVIERPAPHDHIRTRSFSGSYIDDSDARAVNRSPATTISKPPAAYEVTGHPVGVHNVAEPIAPPSVCP